MKFLLSHTTWEDLVQDQKQDRIKFLLKSAKEARKLNLSRRQAAQRMKINYATLSKLIQQHKIDWPVNGVPTGPKNIPISEYERCAKLGMNQTQTAAELGVSGPAVSAMSIKYNIKFNRKGLSK